jgi:hypothetical protein
MKKQIKIYAHPNDPCLELLAVGRSESPDRRFIRFFEERKKFREIMGIEYKLIRKIVIKKVEWI